MGILVRDARDLPRPAVPCSLPLAGRGSTVRLPRIRGQTTRSSSPGGWSRLWHPPSRSCQGTDTLEDIENLVGSAYTDKLDGNGGTNVLNGGGGNDGLWGQAGNDTILGGDGNDTVGGGLGNDRLNGGTGVDIVHYGAAPAVVVNLTTGSATGEGTDTLSLLESITGSSGADKLTGSAAANAIGGGGGNDALLGEGGNDTLTAPAVSTPSPEEQEPTGATAAPTETPPPPAKP